MDAVQQKLCNFEVLEQKARKKLKKAQKKQVLDEICAAEAKILECERQKELMQAEGKQNFKCMKLIY